jgi:excisionase family DNA binding protein
MQRPSPGSSADDPGIHSAHDEWLALGPASALLGVDRDTLRRWANEGRVEVFQTPGGHRRFRRHSLERLILSRSQARSTMASLGATPQRLTDAYRRTYVSGDGLTPDPLEAVAEADRALFRRTGRKLVDALVAHLDSPPAPSSPWLEQATTLSARLGRRMAATGTSLTASTALFIAARRPFMTELGALAKRRRLDSRDVARLFQQATEALDGCLLAFIDAHRSHPTSQENQ